MIEPFIYPVATLIAGVDEVGRGPLVGAVVTAAVILDPGGFEKTQRKTPPGAV
jgi:ribonuclease HII